MSFPKSLLALAIIALGLLNGATALPTTEAVPSKTAPAAHPGHTDIAPGKGGNSSPGMYSMPPMNPPGSHGVYGGTRTSGSHSHKHNGKGQGKDHGKDHGKGHGKGHGNKNGQHKLSRSVSFQYQHVIVGEKLTISQGKGKGGGFGSKTKDAGSMRPTEAVGGESSSVS